MLSCYVLWLPRPGLWYVFALVLVFLQRHAYPEEVIAELLVQVLTDMLPILCLLDETVA